ncbi:type IV secretory system conjugative DNA transfer family protein [Actinomyces howellii]|uniref:Conjugal transfer coupling protein TraG n=1 Tax=Actinomyces howellii TaxID=52771 RepID=A0A3S4R2K2_9ACTO|nr:TraM recognition domain-containing protein [Actinomyces howellii]VEG29999.1 conjugal transfer coupling protein TraG [Actinomyces howellii]
MNGWQPSTLVKAMALAIGGWALAAFTLGTQAWAHATGIRVPLNPFTALALMARGQLSPTAGTWASVVVAGLVLAALPAAMTSTVRARRRGDGAARLTGRPADTASLNEREVADKARRLGVKADVAGLPVGRAVAGGRRLWSSFEDVCVMIAGPRTGKTSCWVVPRVLRAPGAAVVTSNKRDVLDSTRQERARRGRVWVFDPQGIADEPQSWWWDITSYVTDAMQAQALARIFVDTTRPAGAQASSAYFDAASRNLIAALLLAAARSEKPLSALHGWLNDEADREPVRLLRAAGEMQMAQTLEGIMNLVYQTRSGVYGGASTTMSFLLNDRAMRWVTPQPFLTQLRPEDLVASTDTLYCLSQEGRRSAAPIVTALTVAVTEAAVDHAKTQAGGRLAAPLLIELDEAANVCRWGDLPAMYSHFGSRGICVDTLVQSWSQGTAAWGEEGMRTLWSAANVKVYGGGVSEKGFLTDLSELLGSHWVPSKQRTRSRQGWSATYSMDAQQRQIATVADLQALPAGRAWVLASGSKPVLTKMIPFWKVRGE